MSPRTCLRTSPLSRLPALLLLVLVGSHAPAGAATSYNWVSNASGFASDPARWSPSGVPDSTSTLTYNQTGFYSVTFTNDVPKSQTQNVGGGNVTFLTPDTHRLHTLSITSGSAKFEGGTVLGRYPEGANFLISTGGLELNNGAEFTGGGYVATTGASQLSVFRGSRLHLGMLLDIRKDGYVTVWGSGGPSSRFSGIDGGPIGISVGGTLYAYDGAFVDVQGPVGITGGTSGAVQSIHVGPGVPGGDSYLNTQSTLTVGRKLGSPSIPLFGLAQLHVEDRSWVHAGGLIQVGDPVGDEGCLIRMNPGATLIASGGIKVYSTVGPALELRGGITHVRGGTFEWPASKLLTVSSHLDTPELWLSNGNPNIGPNSGSPLVMAMIVGRGGDGRLRVTQPGTVLPIVGAFSVGDSVGGCGNVVVDTSATLSITGTLSLGSGGQGIMNVHNGSHLTAANLFIAAAETGSGVLDVRGAGTTAILKDKVRIAGNDFGDGGHGAFVVDNGATATVQQTGVNPSAVTVHASGGFLAVAGGGVLQAGLVDVRDRLYLGGGTIQCLSTSLTATGRLQGYGSIAGHLFTSGILQPGGDLSEFGRVAITGNFRQFSPGHFEVQLGSDGGPRNDSLAVNGTVTLDGTLDLSPGASFVRTPGESFTIITGSSITGTFAAVTWNGMNVTDQVQVVYGPTSVRVVIPANSVDVDPARNPGTAGEVRFTRQGGPRDVQFELTLPDAAEVQVALYDASGRRVATLAEGALPAGRQTLAMPQPSRLPSGMYFARASVRTSGRHVERVVKVVRLR